MNITKTDFINQLRKKHLYTRRAAEALVDDFLSLVLDNMEAGNTVSFYGFGTFDFVERKERACPNPQNREETCVIPTHWVPKFYPGEPMRRAVSTWEHRGLLEQKSIVMVDDEGTL